MRTRKFVFEINWPLEPSTGCIFRFNALQLMARTTSFRLNMAKVWNGNGSLPFKKSDSFYSELLCSCYPSFKYGKQGFEKKGSENTPAPILHSIFHILPTNWDDVERIRVDDLREKHFPRNITYKKIMPQNCQQKTICLWVCHLGHAPVPKK